MQKKSKLKSIPGDFRSGKKSWEIKKIQTKKVLKMSAHTPYIFNDTCTRHCLFHAFRNQWLVLVN